MIRYPAAALLELASARSEIPRNMIDDPKGLQHNLREPQSVPTRALDRSPLRRITYKVMLSRHGGEKMAQN
jgi:hypothetical protein